LPLEQGCHVKVSALVGITDAPLDVAGNQLLHLVLNSFIDLGRSEPLVYIGSEGWKLSRTRTRSTTVEESKRIHEGMIAKFGEMLYVSLAINPGTIERRHFLGIMVLAS
jgi:hypothetical protein